MRIFLPFVLLLLITKFSSGQTIFKSGSIASTISAGANSASWSIGTSSATATLTADQTKTDYLYVRGFDLSELPNNAVVSSFFVFLSRVAGATVVDSAVRFVIDGNVYYASGSNAASTPTAWPPPVGGFASYTFNTAILGGLTPAQLKDSRFGIAIAGLRTGSSDVVATVGTQFTIAMSYNILAPITLTDFSLRMNAEGHVQISFATSNEEQVDQLFVERSNNGKDFTTLFTLAPKGARNLIARYYVTDKDPREGNNYYRITELDKNGIMHVYATRLIRVERNAKVFRGYFDGSSIVAELKLSPGKYTISIADMSGAVVSRSAVLISSSASVQRLTGPYKAGVYIVSCYGEGQVYSVRVPVGPAY